MTTQLSEQDATAVESGGLAPQRFQEKGRAGAAIPKERVDQVASAALEALHGVIREHRVTYEEYDLLNARAG